MKHDVHCLPEADRPRERLLQQGADALSTAELIAVILGSGVKGKSILALATEIVSHFGTLQRLADASVEELCQIHGMGPAKAIQLLATIGLGRKLSRDSIALRPSLSTPSQVYQLVRGDLENQKQEVFMVILQDAKNFLIGKEIVAMGTLSEALVHPREIFHPAIRRKAAGIVLAHNHPSGDPSPSQEDVTVTQALVASGKLLGIPVHDHLIVGKNRFVSLKQSYSMVFA